MKGVVFMTTITPNISSVSGVSSANATNLTVQSSKDPRVLDDQELAQWLNKQPKEFFKPENQMLWLLENPYKRYLEVCSADQVKLLFSWLPNHSYYTVTHALSVLNRPERLPLFIELLKSHRIPIQHAGQKHDNYFARNLLQKYASPLDARPNIRSALHIELDIPNPHVFRTLEERDVLLEKLVKELTPQKEEEKKEIPTLKDLSQKV